MEFSLCSEKSVSSHNFRTAHTLPWWWPRGRGACGVWSLRQALSSATPFSLLAGFMPIAVRQSSYQPCYRAAPVLEEALENGSPGKITGTFHLSLSQARMPLTCDVPDLLVTFSVFFRCSSTQDSQPRGCQHVQRSY